MFDLLPLKMLSFPTNIYKFLVSFCKRLHKCDGYEKHISTKLPFQSQMSMNFCLVNILYTTSLILSGFVANETSQGTRVDLGYFAS